MNYIFAANINHNAMGKKSIIKDKSFGFAVRVVNLYKLLTTERKEFVLSKQMLRAGTSVGANVREALNAESRADFIHKLGIAQKECDETCFRLELLHAGNYINTNEFSSIYKDCMELLTIIRSIILSSKETHNS
jgi:four helix bundle protein